MWNRLSLDEIEHNQELIKEYKHKPVETVKELVRVCLCHCLMWLGVENPWDIHARLTEMDLLGIEIKDIDEEQGRIIAKIAHQNYNDRIKGFYVWQWNIPRYFIPDPPEPKMGETVVRIVDINSDEILKEFHLRVRHG